MDKKAVRNIWSRINQDFKDYRLKNRLLVRVPIGHILCGILFEPSAFSKEPFYINAFVQPLYVPSDHLVLTFGIRVPGQWQYVPSEIDKVASLVSKALEEHALLFFPSLATPELFYKNARENFPEENIHFHQLLVLTAILLRKRADAQRHFDTLKCLVEKTDRQIPWPQAVLDETLMFLDESMRDIDAGREHLLAVESATLRALRLDEFPRLQQLTSR